MTSHIGGNAIEHHGRASARDLRWAVWECVRYCEVEVSRSPSRIGIKGRKELTLVLDEERKLVEPK